MLFLKLPIRRVMRYTVLIFFFIRSNVYKSSMADDSENLESD